MKEIESSWGDEGKDWVTPEHMILFCQTDGTTGKHERGVRLSSFIHSVFHRGDHKEEKKKENSGPERYWMKWDSGELCLLFSLIWCIHSLHSLNAWSSSLKANPFWSKARSLWKLPQLWGLTSSTSLLVKFKGLVWLKSLSDSYSWRVARILILVLEFLFLSASIKVWKICKTLITTTPCCLHKQNH